MLTRQADRHDEIREVVALALQHGRPQRADQLEPHVVAVHRLSELGAVVTWKASGTSKDGFEAEWRAISALIVDGEALSRAEIYDENDLYAALAKFEEVNASTS